MVVSKGFIISIVLMLGHIAPIHAQIASPPERSAITSIQKKRWDKARDQVLKALRKDSINAAARYVYGLYFFSRGNPSFHVDSAYRYVTESLEHFERSPVRERDRMKRFGIDGLVIIDLRNAIDSAAFKRARDINTEEAYIRFLDRHPHAAQRNQALALRDEAAFTEALRINTYQSFSAFLQKYPQAERATEARQRYDRLLFETKTKDGRLASYEQFFAEHPESPFRSEVERMIFELSTAAGTPESFITFLNRYPDSPFHKRARAILFHLLLSQQEPIWPSGFLNDSLKNILALRRSYLVPFLSNGKFGFMDKNGREVIAPKASAIFEEFLCGDIIEDVIVLPDRILARNGTVVYSGQAEGLDELGAGFLAVEADGCLNVVHKSGFTLAKCVEEAKVLNGNFVALRENDMWSVTTLMGRPLLSGRWKSIDVHHDILLLKEENTVKLARFADLARLAECPKPLWSITFDEVKPWSNGRLWARSGDRQGVLTMALDTIIPFDKHELKESFFGVTAQTEPGVYLYDQSGKKTPLFRTVVEQEPWVAVNDGQWRLFDPRSQRYQSHSFDSIAFEGPFFIGISADSASAFFPGGAVYDFFRPSHIAFIPGKDSASFLMAEQDGKKTIFSNKGEKLFTGEFDEIHYAGMGLFIVTSKERKGIVSYSGKVLLPAEYDAIGNLTGGTVSLLKKQKFGLYDITKGKLIAPQYDKNLNHYANGYIAAYRNGAYGFIGWDNKPLSPFEFDEVRYWNDTTALVKKGMQWMLYDLLSKTVLEGGIDKLNMIKETSEEQLAIIRKGDQFGVISSRYGTVIPATFSDIVNVGSREEPLYFTEKHVEEASIFVVIYYDRYGKMIRREVYEPEDYERIYCTDKF